MKTHITVSLEATEINKLAKVLGFFIINNENPEAEDLVKFAHRLFTELSHKDSELRESNTVP